MEKVPQHKKTSCTTNSNELAGCEHSCERNANANSVEETKMKGKKYCQYCHFSSIHKAWFHMEEALLVSQIN